MAYDTRFRLIATLMLGAVSACTAAEDPDAGEVAGGFVTDSAGVRVVESSAAQAEAMLPWELDAVPFLRIGEEEGDPALLFTSIMSVASQSGSIAVADQRTRDVRLFTMEGIPSGRVQQLEPSGPGSLGLPRIFPDAASGGFLLVDVVSSAGGFVDASGRVDRVFRWESGGGAFQRSQPVAWTGQRLVLISRHEEGALEAQRTGGTSMERTRWAQVTPGHSVPQAWDRETRVSIHYVPQGRPGAVGSPRMMGIPAPLTQPLHLVAREGRVYKTTNNGTEILLLDDRGAELARYRIGGGKPLVSAADVEREARAFAGRMLDSADDIEAYVQQALAVPSAEVLPRFSTLVAGPDGEVWARDVDGTIARGSGSGTGTGSTWTVFDSTGVVRGRVYVPEGVTLFQVEEDWILGTVHDGMGVPRVVLHSLYRRSTP